MDTTTEIKKIHKLQESDRWKLIDLLSKNKFPEKELSDDNIRAFINITSRDYALNDDESAARRVLYEFKGLQETYDLFSKTIAQSVNRVSSIIAKSQAPAVQPAAAANVPAPAPPNYLEYIMILLQRLEARIDNMFVCSKELADIQQNVKQIEDYAIRPRIEMRASKSEADITLLRYIDNVINMENLEWRNPVQTKKERFLYYITLTPFRKQK